MGHVVALLVNLAAVGSVKQLMIKIEQKYVHMMLFHVKSSTFPIQEGQKTFSIQEGQKSAFVEMSSHK